MQQCSATIIPLAPASRPGSSNLPEGLSFPSGLRHREGSTFAFAKSTHRAGPALPSYLVLHHAGFAMPPALLPERWALTPPFHPYQRCAPCEDVPKVFLRAITGLRAAGGIVSVALSVTQPFPATPPGVTRRIALLCSRRVVSGLSSRPVRFRVPSQRSSGSPATFIISRTPPFDSWLFRTFTEHRIAPMRVREAKDFRVQQITRQASIEAIPLSDLEKRMMYFTEGRTAVDDPIQLNEEFEAQCDTPTYEKKVVQLMKHAYKRLKSADSPDKGTWDRATRCLRRGDHYILVTVGR